MMSRAQQAQQVRESAAEKASARGPVTHFSNREEYEYRGSGEGQREPSLIANYTKGLPHNVCTGLLVNPVDYQLFVRGIDSGEPVDFAETPLGPQDKDCDGHPIEPLNGCPTVTGIRCDKPASEHTWESQLAKTGNKGGPVDLRAWEASAVGRTFELEGPDPLSVTMPPAPRLDSKELAAEMVEVYAQALLRDHHVSQFRNDINGHGPIDAEHDYAGKRPTTGITPDAAFGLMNLQEWFGTDNADTGLTDAERRRLRPNVGRRNAFRGITPGDDVGPYISQFLLIGNSGINSADKSRTLAEGLISYGSIRIDQRVRVARPTIDYMTDFPHFIDVQNAARVSGLEDYIDPKVEPDKLSYRFITTPRDLATYVHYDALYEAYLNACLIMLGIGIPFDPGLPFQFSDVYDHQQGFAQFGGPHILSLVCEVATRALKAVRFQKFNVHRRLRPEALAARVAKYAEYNSDPAFRPVKPIRDRLERQFDGRSILDYVGEHNQKQNGSHDPDLPLLPMAFPEGSPMHPAYGAGHATVAGACVTILKAFFDAGSQLIESIDGTNDTRPICYEPNYNGSKIVSLLEAEPYGEQAKAGFVKTSGAKRVDQSAFREIPAQPTQYDFQPLTVEGELNKLASNISIGRDWAGVHYFTDYIESLRMGEKIAIGLLEEQKLTYRENFSMTVPLFDGSSVRI